MEAGQKGKAKNILIYDIETYASPSSCEEETSTLEGSSPSSRPTITVGEKDAFPKQAGLELENLHLSVTYKWRSMPLFDRTGGVMTMSTCSLTLDTNPSRSVWSVDACTVNLISVSLASDPESPLQLYASLISCGNHGVVTMS